MSKSLLLRYHVKRIVWTCAFKYGIVLLGFVRIFQGVYEKGTRMNQINIPKIIEYWKQNALDDLDSVEQFLQYTSKYLQAMFFLHLSTEKILKALFVKTNKEHAPLTHNLLFLAEKCSLNLTEEQKKLLAKINEFNLECRYPNDKMALKNKLNKENTSIYFKEAQEFIIWISTQLD